MSLKGALLLRCVKPTHFLSMYYCHPLWGLFPCLSFSNGSISKKGLSKTLYSSLDGKESSHRYSCPCFFHSFWKGIQKITDIKLPEWTFIQSIFFVSLQQLKRGWCSPGKRFLPLKLTGIVFLKQVEVEVVLDWFVQLKDVLYNYIAQ